jgi:hypothetical protein
MNSTTMSGGSGRALLHADAGASHEYDSSHRLLLWFWTCDIPLSLDLQKLILLKGVAALRAHAANV